MFDYQDNSRSRTEESIVRRLLTLGKIESFTKKLISNDTINRCIRRVLHMKRVLDMEVVEGGGGGFK